MTTRELCILEDELQTLWDDVRTNEKAVDRYLDIANEDYNIDTADELHQAWLDAYSKYAYLYDLCKKLGYKVTAPNDRFRLKK